MTLNERLALLRAAPDDAGTPGGAGDGDQGNDDKDGQQDGGPNAAELQKRAEDAEKALKASKDFNARQLREIKALKETSKQLEDMGGLDAIREIVEERQKHQDEADKKTGNVDELLQRQKERAEKKIQEAEAKLAAREQELMSTIEGLTIDSELKSAIASGTSSGQEVVPELRDALFQYQRGKIKRIEDPSASYGFRAAVVLGDGDEISIGEHVRQFLESEQGTPWLKPAVNNGGGAYASGGSRLPRPNRGKMTPKAKSDYISKHGREAYESLPM